MADQTFGQGLASQLLGEAFKDQATKLAQQNAVAELARQKNLLRFQSNLSREYLPEDRAYAAEVAKKKFQNDLISSLLGSDIYSNAPEVMSKYAGSFDSGILSQLKLKPDERGSYYKYLMGQPAREEKRLKREALITELKSAQDRLKQLESYGSGATMYEYKSVIDDINRATDALKKEGIDLGGNIDINAKMKDKIRSDIMSQFPEGGFSKRVGKGNAPVDLKIGDIQDGYKYKGGDPALPSSWEKVKQ